MANFCRSFDREFSVFQCGSNLWPPFVMLQLHRDHVCGSWGTSCVSPHHWLFTRHLCYPKNNIYILMIRISYNTIHPNIIYYILSYIIWYLSLIQHHIITYNYHELPLVSSPNQWSARDKNGTSRLRPAAGFAASTPARHDEALRSPSVVLWLVHVGTLQ